MAGHCRGRAGRSCSVARRNCWACSRRRRSSGCGWRRADELVLPTSPLLEVFDPEALGEDGPLSVLDEDFAARWPSSALVAVGVLDGFVVTEDGIRDLDLVAD